MAVVSQISNHYKHELMSGDIDFDAHVFKIMLMDNTFTFDKDTHAKYADVSADELGAGSGYTVGGETLAGGALVEDDVNDRAEMTWNDQQWDAVAPGPIGPTGAAIIYDDSETDKTVVGCIDYGEDFSIPDGSSFLIKDIAVRDT